MHKIKEKKHRQNFRIIFRCCLVLIFFLIFKTSLCQKLDDSTHTVRVFSQLIQQKQFASAHHFLEDKIRDYGVNPNYICLITDNGLRNYFRQDNFEIFYLINQTDLPNNLNNSNTNYSSTGSVRHPRQLLEKVVAENPNNAFALKLLGDYYNIQLQYIKNLNDIPENKLTGLEEKIFSYYSHAARLGYNDVSLNRWLGDYYLNKNQLELAEQYYQNNIKASVKDPYTYHYMAKLYYKKKSYTQAYNYAVQSLEYFAREDLYLKYDAMILAAKSLRELSENDKFLETITKCQELIPDEQPAYILLSDYYINENDFDKVEKVLTKMLLYNPFEPTGYRKLENYIISSKRFEFSDSLFDEMLLKFENWDEALANIYWAKGNVAYYRGEIPEAKNFWEIGRNYMRSYLPENHDLIQQIGDESKKK